MTDGTGMRSTEQGNKLENLHPSERSSSGRDRRGRESSRDPRNIRRRVLKPLVEEVNAPWAAFHTFRHTFASLHLKRGTNLLQLSRALGHHSAAFTLSRCAHLLPGDEAPALDLDAVRSVRTIDSRRPTPGGTNTVDCDGRDCSVAGSVRCPSRLATGHYDSAVAVSGAE